MIAAWSTLLESLPERYGDRPLLIDALGTLDASACRQSVGRIAAALQDRGAGVVASALDNGRSAVLLDLGAQLAGVTHLPVPPYFSPAQRQHALQDSGASLLIQDARWPAPSGWASLPPLPDLGEHAIWTREQGAPVVPQGTACITYTSGSTGAAKGICLAGDTLLGTAGSLEQAFSGLPLRAHLSALPLSTLLETVGVYAALMRGATLHLPRLADLGYSGAADLDFTRFVDTFNAARPDSVILVPQLLSVLVHAARSGGLQARPRLIAVGGAKVPPSLLQAAERCGLPVFEGYGLSEAGSVVSLNRPGAQRAGSVGKPLPHVALRIAGDGEIWLRGPAPLARERSTSATSPDGWWPTGDLGCLDEDGFLHLKGRRRNVFITAFGRNVSPEWVEAELLPLPGVRQLVVHGEALPRNLALVQGDRALFDAGDGATRLAEANARLPDYARVSELIWSGIPWTPENGLLTGNGRPRREALLAAHAAQIEAKTSTNTISMEQGVLA